MGLVPTPSAALGPSPLLLLRGTLVLLIQGAALRADALSKCRASCTVIAVASVSDAVWHGVSK